MIKFEELILIALSLFFALESWNLEISDRGRVERQGKTVSTMITEASLNQIQSFWLTSVTLSASVSNCRGR